MDFEAEFLEAADETVGDLGAVSSIEVVGTQVVVLDPIAEHVIGGDEHGGGYGDDRLLRTAAALDTQELCAQVAVAFA